VSRQCCCVKLVLVYTRRTCVVLSRYDFRLIHSFPTDSVFPQGLQAAWAVMIAIPTMCLMAAGMGGCNYVRVPVLDRVLDYQLDSGLNVNVTSDDQLGWSQIGWGLIWREESDYEDELTSRRIQCTGYTKSQRDSFDGIWKLGMAFAYIAIIIVSISSIAALPRTVNGGRMS
jgi:hypothetical protein